VSLFFNNKRLNHIFKRQDVAVKADGRDLLLSRQLNHKKDIPGSGQWRMQVTQEKDGCWHCDNWTYTIVFWNTEIGEWNDKNSLNIDNGARKKLVKTLSERNGDALNSNESVPVLFSGATNWKPKPFVPLVDFLDYFEKKEAPGGEHLS